MISHEHRVVFIHVPKAAGTSVELALGHHGPDGLQRGEAAVHWGTQDHRTVRQLQWRWAGRAAWRSAENRLEWARAAKAALRPNAHPANRVGLTPEQWDRYCTFAIVRNPWARVYSAYRNVISDPLHRARWHIPEGIGLDDFLVRFGSIDLLRTQTSWIVDYHGRIAVDHVCRFERLEHDLEAVRVAAAMPDLVLPHVNRGAAGGAHLDAFDDRSRRLVAERYREEIERFGYRFDEP